MNTVTLYTSALNHIETLTITTVELMHHNNPVRKLDRIGVITSYPTSADFFNNSKNLVARVQVSLSDEDIDEVCRIDRYLLTMYPDRAFSPDSERYKAETELKPLHTAAQHIVKAVLSERETSTSSTVDHNAAYRTAMLNLEDTFRKMPNNPIRLKP